MMGRRRPPGPDSSDVRRASQRGQSTVEFALVTPLFLLLVLGTIDFGVMFEQGISLTEGARDAGRLASIHPTAWSSASTAPSNTIEGVAQANSGTARLPNDDTHILVQYLVPGSGTATVCGHYSVSSRAFVAASGYTQATCVVPGNLIQVQITYTYPFVSPLFASMYRAGVPIRTGVTVVEES